MGKRRRVHGAKPLAARRKCADNPDPAFASCAVAQELTDEQIDQEGSSDEEVSLRPSDS